MSEINLKQSNNYKNYCERELDQSIAKELARADHVFTINDSYDDMAGKEHMHGNTIGFEPPAGEFCSGTSIYPAVFNALMQNDTVETISIPRFRTSVAKWLSEVIHYKANITGIEYRGANEFSDTEQKIDPNSSEVEATYMLVEALKNNTTVRRLAVNYAKRIEEERALLDLLKVNHTIQNFELRINPFRTESGGKELADSIRANHGLQALTLAGYRFDQEGFKAFTDVIKQNTNLRKLYIGSSQCEKSEDLLLLKDALLNNHYLTHIKMPLFNSAEQRPFKPLDKSTAKAFIEIAKFNPLIQELQLTFEAQDKEELQNELQVYLDRNKKIADCQDVVSKMALLKEVLNLRKAEGMTTDMMVTPWNTFIIAKALQRNSMHSANEEKSPPSEAQTPRIKI